MSSYYTTDSAAHTELKQYQEVHHTNRRNGLVQELTIPLNRVNQVTQLWYVSAIALKYATSLRTTATDLANRIATEFHLSPLNINLLIDDILQSTRIWTTVPGWVNWHISDRGVAIWLQWLLSELLAAQRFTRDREMVRSPHSPPSAIEPSLLFQMQYAHARCATVQRLVQAQIPSVAACVNEAGMIDRTVWLDEEHQLRSRHPSELALIATIADLLDQADEAPLSPVKGAIALSQRVLEMDAQCRLLGGVDEAIARFRWHLLYLTRLLLHELLIHEFNAAAPLSL